LIIRDMARVMDNLWTRNNCPYLFASVQLRDPVRNGHLQPSYALLNVGNPDLLFRLPSLAILRLYLPVDRIKVQGLGGSKQSFLVLLAPADDIDILGGVLEVENPGGLYGRVTLDRLQEGQSTRNRLLMHLMEDVHLVENRGSGIDTMLDAMQKRGLPAPVFEDKRTAFLVKFYQKTPIEMPLADEEQRILAYVKKHGFIKRADAQEMLDVNEARARYLLQKMQKAGQLRKEGRYRDARYLLGYQ
jgi:hypothetical protein